MLDLTNLDVIKSIIKENRLWPKKGYGQNFLVAKQPLISLIKAAEIDADDTIVEIGPGLGTLTQELAKHAKLVLALESDYNLVTYLRKYFKSAKNVKILHQDVLAYDLGLINNNYKLVSNLPYNITSPVIRKFLESGFAHHLQKDPEKFLSVQGTSSSTDRNVIYGAGVHSNDSQCGIDDKRFATCDRLVLMVQKEVAERLTAKPGSADRGILTVMVELFGEAEIVEIVPRKCFYPIPSVDSAIIKFCVDPRHESRFRVDPRPLMKFVKVGFSQKRRQIHHPLADNLHLPTDKIKDILKSVNIESTLRAEDLNIDQWISLYKKFF